MTARVPGKWASLAEDYFTGPAPVEALQRYTAIEAGRPAFTGALFNTWAGGGLAQPDTVTSDDLIAVQYLSMRPFSGTIWHLLSGRRGLLEAALAAVPRTVSLWDPPDVVLPALQAATRAWQVVKEIPGADWVTAGKVMARKRPALVPVYDRFVRSAIGGGQFWEPLHEWLRVESNVALLEEIRGRAGISAEQVPLLRVFDIVLWMAKRSNRLRADTDEDAELRDGEVADDLEGEGP